MDGLALLDLTCDQLFNLTCDQLFNLPCEVAQGMIFERTGVFVPLRALQAVDSLQWVELLDPIRARAFASAWQATDVIQPISDVATVEGVQAVAVEITTE